MQVKIFEKKLVEYERAIELCNLKDKDIGNLFLNRALIFSKMYREE